MVRITVSEQVVSGDALLNTQDGKESTLDEGAHQLWLDLRADPVATSQPATLHPLRRRHWLRKPPAHINDGRRDRFQSGSCPQRLNRYR